MNTYVSKSHLRRTLCVSTALAGGVLLIAAPGAAQTVLPNGPSPAGGNPTFTVDGVPTAPGGVNGTGTNLTVTLNDNRTIINWNNFDIATGRTVNFTDAATNRTAVLNRDLSGNVSEINGSLLSDSNISVYLLNTSGILFGNGANVNVGGLVASTLGLTDADFLDGNDSFAFSGAGTNGIGIDLGATGAINGGEIVAFIGHFVNVAAGSAIGATTAPQNAVFVAANDVAMAATPGSPLSLTINAGTAVSNAMVVGGTVNGQNVYVGMASQAGIVDSVLNISGVVTATTATATDRGIVLAAGTSASGITVDGAGDTTGNAKVSITGSLTADDGGVPANNASVEIRALDAITATGPITADDQITIASMRGDVTATGAINAGDDVTLTSSESGTVTASNVTLGGDYSVTAGDFGGGTFSPTFIGTGNDFTITDTQGGLSLGMLTAPGTLTVNILGPTNTLTLNNGALTSTTEAVVLNAASGISVVGGPATINSATGQVLTGPITLGDDLTLASSGGGAITVNGTVDGANDLIVNTSGTTTFASAIGATSALASLTTDTGGTTALNGGVVTTTGAQNYGDAVALGADTLLTGGSGTFASGLDGNGFDLTLNFDGTTVLDGTFTDIDNLATGGGGTTQLGGVITTTGSQTFGEAVTLAGATQLTSSGNAAIAFGGTVNGANTLTVTTSGLTSFAGAVGGTTALSALTTNGGGTTAIDGGIVTTTGNQSFGEAVTLGADTVLASSAGDVSLGGTVAGGTNDLVVNTSGTATFTGAVTAGGLGVDAGSVIFSATNSINTLAANIATGGIAFSNTAALEIGSVGGIDGVTAAAGNVAISSTGSVTLAQGVTSSAGNVDLAANGGTLTGSGVVGGNQVVLRGAAGIGAAGARVNTAANSLAAVAGIGGAFLSEADAVTLQSIGLVDNGASGAYDLLAGGTITVAGSVTSSGSNVSLATSAGDISLAATGLVNAVSGTVSLNAAGAIDANAAARLNAIDITLRAQDFQNSALSNDVLQEGNNLSVTDTAGGLTLVSLSAANRLDIDVLAGGGLTVTDTLAAGGTLDLSAATITFDGVTVSGANVIVGGPLTLTGAGSTVSASGSGTVAFSGTINGGETLGVTANGGTTFAGAVGTTTALTSLTVTGPSAINGGAVTTTGAQSYSGLVTLGADTVLTGGTGSFGAGVTGNDNDLTLNFGGTTALNGTFTGIEDLATGGGGTTSLSGNITTSGTQNFGDDVTLAGATVLTSSGNGAVAFGGTVNGAQALTVTTSGLTSFAGIVGGGTALTSLTTNGGGATALNGGAVTTTAAQTYTDAVTLGANTVLTGGSGTFGAGVDGNGFDLTLNFGGTTAIDGGFTEIDDLATGGGGSTSLSGTITTTGAQNFGEAVTLAGNTQLTSSGNGAITFGGTVNGGNTLAVTTSGLTSFAGIVGGTTALTSLTTNGGGATSLGGNVTTSGAQAYSDAVSLAADVILTGTDGTLSGAITGNANELDLVFSGATVIGAGASGLDTLASFGGGTTELNGTISTSGSQTYVDAVTLGSTVTAISTAADIIDFQSTLNGPGGLTVTTGGVTRFGGAVGGGTALAALTTNGGGTTEVNGGSVRTGGDQTYADAVSLGQSATFTGANGNFNAIDANGFDLILRFTGVTNLNVAPTEVDDLVSDNGGSIILPGNITTIGSQTYADAVTLGANVTLTSTDNEAISLLGTVDGARDLVVTTSGLTTLGGLVGGGTALTSFAVGGGGISAINGGGVTTTGAQTYSDAVTLGAAASLISTGGGLIVLSGSVDGPAALTVTTSGDTAFGGAVGSGTALAALTTNGGGTTAIGGGAVTTTGNQNYADAITLGAPLTTLTSTGGSGTFAALNGGGNDLTMSFAGPIAINGDFTNLSDLRATGSGIDFDGRTLVATDDVVLDGTSGDVDGGTVTAGNDIAISGDDVDADTLTAGDDIAIRAGGLANVRALTSGANPDTDGGAGAADALAGANLLGNDIDVVGGSVDFVTVTANENGAGSDLRVQATTGDLAVTTGTAGAEVVLTAAGSATGGTITAQGGSATISAGPLADFGTVNAGQNVSASAGSTLIGSAAATGGALTLTASSEQLTLGSGSAGTTASVRKTGADGELQVTTLTAGNAPGSTGDITIQSTTNARLTDIESLTGSISVSATAGEVTGIGAGNRADLTALTVGADVSVFAGNLARLGSVTAGGDILVQAGNTTTPRNGSVDIMNMDGTDVAIQATGGSIMAGTIAASDDIVLGAGTSISTAALSASGVGEDGGTGVGDAGAGGTFDLTSGGNILVAAADGAINVAGAISSDVDVALAASMGVTTLDVTAGDDLVIRAGGAVATGNLTTGPDATVQEGAGDPLVTDNDLAGNDIDIAGAGITVGSVRANGAGSDVRLRGPVNGAGPDLDIRSGGEIVVDGAIAARDVALQAGERILALGGIRARDDIVIRAGTSIVTGDLASGVAPVVDTDSPAPPATGEATEAGAADTLLGARIEGHDIDVGGASVTIARADTNSDAAGLGRQSDLRLLASAGQLTLGAATVGGAATLTKQGASGELQVTGTLAAGQAGSPDAMQPAGDVAISSDSNARLGTISSGTGSIAVTAIGEATGIGAGAANLLAPATIADAGQVVDGRDVTVTAGTLARLGTVDAGRNVAVAADTIAIGIGTAANGALRLTADAGTLTASGDLLASGNLDLSATGDLNIRNARSLFGNASATSTGGSTIGLSLRARGDATETAADCACIDLVQGGDTAPGPFPQPRYGAPIPNPGAGGGDVVIDGGRIQKNSLSAGRDIALNARTGAILVSGAAAAGDDIAFRAAGDATIGSVQTGGTDAAGAADTLAMTNLTGNEVDGQAASIAVTNALVGTSTLASDLRLRATSGSLTLGTGQVGGRALLDKRGTTGELQAGTLRTGRAAGAVGDAILVSATNVRAGTVEAAGGAIDIRAGEQANAVTVAADGAIAVTSIAVRDGAVTGVAGSSNGLASTFGRAVLSALPANGGAAGSDRSVSVTAGGLVQLGAVTAGENVTVAAGTAGIADRDGAIDISSATASRGALSLTAYNDSSDPARPADIRLGASNAGGVLATDGALTVGSAAGTDAVLTTQGTRGDVVVGRTLVAGQNVALTSVEDVLLAAAPFRVEAVAGDVTVSAVRDVDGLLAGGIETGEALINGSGLRAGTIASGGDVVIDGAGNVRLRTVTSSLEDIAVTAGGSVTGLSNTDGGDEISGAGTLNAGRDVTVTAGSLARITAISAGASVATGSASLSGGNLAVTADIVAVQTLSAGAGTQRAGDVAVTARGTGLHAGLVVADGLTTLRTQTAGMLRTPTAGDLGNPGASDRDTLDVAHGVADLTAAATGKTITVVAGTQTPSIESFGAAQLGVVRAGAGSSQLAANQVTVIADRLTVTAITVANGALALTAREGPLYLGTGSVGTTARLDKQGAVDFAGNELRVRGSLTTGTAAGASGNATLISATDARLGAIEARGGAIDIRAGVDPAGNAVRDGDVTGLAVATPISAVGLAPGSGRATLTAAGAIAVRAGGLVQAGSVAAGTDILVEAGSAGVVDRDGAIDISSAVAASGSLSLSAYNDDTGKVADIRLGTIAGADGAETDVDAAHSDAGTMASLVTTGGRGDVVIGRSLRAGGTVAIESTRDVRFAPNPFEVRSRGGDIAVTAIGSVTGLVAGGVGVGAASANGGELRADSLTSGGDLAIDSAGNVRLGAATSTGGSVTVGADGSVTGLAADPAAVTGAGRLFASRDVTVTAGPVARISEIAAGTVDTGATASATGGDIAVTADLVAVETARARSGSERDGDIALTARGSGLHVGTAQADGALALSTGAPGMLATPTIGNLAGPGDSTRDVLDTAHGAADIAAATSVGVTAGRDTPGAPPIGVAQLGVVTAGADATVTADRLTVADIASGGALTLTTREGPLFLGTGRAGTSATLVKGGGGLAFAGDELRVRDSLIAGTDVTIRSATNARLGTVTATAGTVQVRAGADAAGAPVRTGEVTGLAVASPIVAAGLSTSHGRAALTGGGSVDVEAGGLVQLGLVQAGQNVRVEAGSEAIADRDGAIDITSAAAANGSLVLRAYNNDAGRVAGVRLGTTDASGTAQADAVAADSLAGTRIELRTLGTRGDVVVGQSLTANGAVGSGDITLGSVGDVRLASAADTAADADPDGVRSVNDDVAITAAGSVTGLVAGGTGIGQAAAGELRAGTVTGTGDIVIEGAGNARLRDVASRAEDISVAAGGSVTGLASGDTVDGISGAGRLFAGRDVRVTAGDTARVTRIVSGRDSQVEATTSAIGRTNAGGNVGVTSGGAGLHVGTSEAGGTTTFRARTAGTLATPTVGDLGGASGATVDTLATTHGFANLDAQAAGKTVAVTAGTDTPGAGSLGVAQLGTVNAGAGNGAATGVNQIAVTADRLTISSATADNGAIVLATREGALFLGTGSAGTTATLTKNGATDELRVRNGLTAGTATGSVGNVGIVTATDARLANVTGRNGSVDVTATRDVTGIRLAANATGRGGELGFGAANLSTGGAAGLDVNVTAGELAQVESVAAGRSVNIASNSIELTGAMTAPEVNLTNRPARSNSTRLGGSDTGNDNRTGLYVLREAELNRISADRVNIDSGAQNVEVQNSALTANVGRNNLRLLTTGRADVTGTLTAAGSPTTRTIQIGGTRAAANPQDPATLASVIAVTPGSTGGGRLLAGSANLDLRAGFIGVGLSGFLSEIGLNPGGTPTSNDVINNQFVSNPSSTLYVAGLGVPYQDKVFLTANNLSVSYTNYALFQNSVESVSGLMPTGVEIGGLNVAPALSLGSSGDTAPNGFALFGVINGQGGNQAALLGPNAIPLTNVNRSNSRINGCLVGSGGGGCLVSAVGTPPLNEFDESAANILQTAENLEDRFDPIVGTNNEALFTGISSIDELVEPEVDCEGDPDNPQCAAARPDPAAQQDTNTP